MSQKCPLQWSIINCESPYLQNHTGAVVGDYFYIHGGICADRVINKSALNGFYRIKLNPVLGQWTEITDSNSPSLSQHACLVHESRYIIFIGGWTGKVRIPGIHTFDACTGKWLPPALEEPFLSGFPPGAGLSAHSVNLMQSYDKNKFSAIITGREGSLRMQRKEGNIYLLYGDIPDSNQLLDKIKYTYCEAISSLTASSRSYHTSVPINPTTLLSIGGRKENSLDLIKWKINNSSHSDRINKINLDQPGLLKYPPVYCTNVTEFIKNTRKRINDLIPVPSSNQNSWRGHCAIPGNGGYFIGTGEGYNALRHGPTDSACLLMPNSTNSGYSLYNIGKILHPRAYSAYAINSVDGQAWLHGGIGPDGKTMNTLLRLELSES